MTMKDGVNQHVYRYGFSSFVLDVLFLSFVLLGTFVAINLFIAVVINNLDEAKAERLEELQGPVIQEEILNDLRDTQKALKAVRCAIGKGLIVALWKESILER